MRKRSLIILLCICLFGCLAGYVFVLRQVTRTEGAPMESVACLLFASSEIRDFALNSGEKWYFRKGMFFENDEPIFDYYWMESSAPVNSFATRIQRFMCKHNHFQVEIGKGELAAWSLAGARVALIVLPDTQKSGWHRFMISHSIKKDKGTDRNGTDTRTRIDENR